MHFAKNLLVAAMALAAAGAANATLKFGDATTKGNSSLAFVALSNDQTTSVVADLGFQMSDLLVGGALRGTTGAADNTVVSASWNLGTGAVTKTVTDGLTGAVTTSTVAGTFAYGNAASFLSTFSTANGGFTWGVIGGDGIGGTTSATNVVASQNIVFTTAAVDLDNSRATGTTNAAVSNGAVNVSNLFAANNTVTGTTNTAGKFGSSTATAGAAFLGTTMAPDGVIGNFGQQLGSNNFLVQATDTAYILRAQLNAPLVNMTQLGAREDVFTDVKYASTFTFDEATQTLTYTTTVPEPGTYAMLLAGLAAVGFMARRRAAR